WGEMTRQGFSQSEKKLSRKEKLILFANSGLKRWGVFSISFIVLYMIGVVVEWIWYKENFNNIEAVAVLKYLLLYNTVFLLKLLAVLGLVYFILRSVREKLANVFVIAAATLIIVSQYGLFLYFAETNNILGADLFYYSWAEIKQILKSSGMLNVKNVALIMLLAAATAIPLALITKSAFKSWYA